MKDNQTKWNLNWWDTNQREFPLIAAAARDYLVIPLSKVDIKRLFNVGRDILGIRRFAMSTKTLGILIILRDNLVIAEKEAE